VEIYRLSHANFADLSGKGGLFGAGRWHERGSLINYTASSRSLAALERLVHESIEDLPELVMLTIWVPDDIGITRYTVNDLPDEWDAMPDIGLAREIGDLWLKNNATLLAQVPSAVIRDEFNYLLNPLHPDLDLIKVVDSRPFFYDARLKKMIT
jgi:RES domain-containing protein